MRLLTVLSCTLALVATSAFAEPPKPIERAEGSGYNPVPPAKGFRYPDCFCTDSKGRRIEMGEMTCLQIGSEQFLAQCDMSLNNPIWRRVSEGCPSV